MLNLIIDLATITLTEDNPHPTTILAIGNLLSRFYDMAGLVSAWPGKAVQGDGHIFLSLATERTLAIEFYQGLHKPRFKIYLQDAQGATIFMRQIQA